MASTLTLGCSPRALGETGNCDAGESFAASDPTHPLVRFSLYAHGTSGNVQRARDYVADLRAIGSNAWVLSNDCDVGVRYYKPFALDTVDCECQHLHGAASLVGGIGIGKKLADVSLARRAQNRVSQCVRHCVRIGVTNQ